MGVELSMTRGILKAMISKVTPDHLRGTGFSVVCLAQGVMIVLANKIAGYLSQDFGPSYPFLFGFYCTCFTIFLYWIAYSRTKREIIFNKN